MDALQNGAQIRYDDWPQGRHFVHHRFPHILPGRGQRGEQGIAPLFVGGGGGQACFVVFIMQILCQDQQGQGTRRQPMIGRGRRQG